MAGILKSSLADPGAWFPLDAPAAWYSSPSFSSCKSPAKQRAAPPRWVVAPGAAWHCHICMSPAGVTSPSASSTAVTKQGHLHAAMVCKPWLALLAECHRRTNAERTRCCGLSYTVSTFPSGKPCGFPEKKKKHALPNYLCKFTSNLFRMWHNAASAHFQALF